jgi:hypothetical protein
MDDILRRVFPPRRTARFQFRRSAKDDAVWADTLEWQSNVYHLYRLFQCLFSRLDTHYRELGLRLDQLSDREELIVAARRAASWYEQAEQQYRTVCIFDYLYNDLDRFLSKRARRALDTRHKLAENLWHARDLAYQTGCTESRDCV